MKQRELKFRVWRNADKRFIQISGYKLQGGKLYPWEWRFDQTPAYHYTYTLEDVVIMQSTGLTDKNGKEIYEGDVLQMTENRTYHFGEQGKVRYEPDHAGFIVEGKYSKNQYYDTLDCDIACEAIVIGNLYETPDLLTPQPNP